MTFTASLQAIEGLIQDITVRKASSQALREAERRYYNLFENAIEGIFRTTIDGPVSGLPIRRWPGSMVSTVPPS